MGNDDRDQKISVDQNQQSKETNKEEKKQEEKKEVTREASKNDGIERSNQSSKRVVDIVINSQGPSSMLKSGKSGSSNRFEILDSTLDCDEDGIVGNNWAMAPRQVRAASAGVADLMKTLKHKKKGPGDKGKNKVNTSSEGPPPTL
ncbi:hypothetical protein DITRI_Ditri04bG0050800 [Diplodiscus trichospermus]